MEVRSTLRTGRVLLLEFFFYVSGTHFSYRLSEPQGLVRLEVLGNLTYIMLAFSLEVKQSKREANFSFPLRTMESIYSVCESLQYRCICLEIAMFRDDDFSTERK
jgi:hypothetical protein